MQDTFACSTPLRYTAQVTFRISSPFLVPVLMGFALASCSPLCAQQAPAETLFINGNILTGAHLTRLPDNSSTPARVTAMAVAGGRIVAVGSDQEILQRKGAGTEVVDLHGAFTMPGFNDAHVHLASAGQQKLSVDLDATPSLADMQERIRTYTAATRPGQWILGAGWDHTKWASKMLPTRGDLDKVTGDHPAVFYRTDGHIVVANSAALRIAGITSTTADPAGGKIDRGADGTPTGIVREASAIALIYSKVPPPDTETRRKALELALADVAAHGVTSVQDNSEWADWLVLETMEHQGELRVRVAEWMDFNLPVAVLQQRRASHAVDDPMLHLTMLKGFMDGSLGSRTAALAEPYSDDPGNSGLPRYEQDRLNQMASERAAAGFQLGFHAIGDEANAIALNAFSAAGQVAVAAGTPPPPKAPDATVVTRPGQKATQEDLRFRIEHAQVLLPSDFDRMQRLGVIASMQPSHLLTDMAWAEARLGPERARYAYAWRSMLDHHIPLAFGTDYPVESISPMRGLYSAVSRKNEAGTASFHPEQSISMGEAIFAYTQTAAFAEFRDRIKGRLEPGYLADFVVLDRDLISAAPEVILRARVLRTVVGGRTVFTALPQPLATPPPAIPAGRATIPDTE